MTERDRITELEHRIGQATMMGESWVMTPGSVSCAEAGRRILSALDVPRPEWPAAPAREPLVLPPDEFAALKRSARILASIVARNHQVMEAARIEMRQAGAHAAMQWILNSLPDVWDDPETEWDGKESAGAWFDRTESFYRASESAAEAPGDPDPSEDPSRALTGADGSAQERSAASLPAAVPGREALREAISAAIDDGWWSEGPKPSERVMEIVWPLLEHAGVTAIIGTGGDEGND